MAVDPASRKHISSQLDAENVLYPELRIALMRHISLEAATNGISGKASTAMEICQIASVAADGVTTAGDVAPG